MLPAHRLSLRWKFLIALLAIILVSVPPLSHFFLPESHAAFSNIKLQINNSQAAASGVTYSFFFTTSATTSIKQIGIKFCTQAGQWTDTCTVPSGFNPGSPTLASDNIAGTGRTTTDPNTSGERMRIVVSTPASQSTQSMFLNFTGVTNPSTINTSFFVRVNSFSDTGTTTIDYSQAMFAVLDTGSIAVSATVDPNFTFTIAPALSGSVNGDTINVSTTTTNSIPFGSLNTTTASVSAHDLTITTNAGSGYTITASTSANAQSGNPPLISGATNNIDSFTGTNASPTNWSAPNGSTANANTGFFGYTTNDATLCTGTANRFTSGGPNYAGFTTTGQEVACSATGVSAETTRVGWKLAINSIQPAGSYTGTIILVATPTY